MKKMCWMTGLAVVVLIATPRCDDEDGAPELEVLTGYLMENDLDLSDMFDFDGDGTPDHMISAADLYADLSSYFIIDIRAADKDSNGTPDFEDGHIDGAHSVALADVVTYVSANNTGELPVVVVCYTGQTSGFAVVALRLSGYDAKVLKFGMSSWHSDFDIWSVSTGNAASDVPSGWTTDTTVPSLPTFDEPVLDTGHDTGAAILQARISDMLAGNCGGVTATDVLTTPSAYHILNYWSETAWATHGHVTGALQVTPGSISVDSGLAFLDPDGPNLIYCWTGQTASIVAAYLTVLGYNAMVMKFGGNALIHDHLTSHKWDAGAACMDFPYETGP